ncbi:MAG: phage tail tape measure protein [Hungatella sp.]|nr:phage tail tape measure protein [Hungatella sp.]
MDNIFKVIESLTGDLPKVKEAIEELRQVDTLLTQISKTSQNLSLADLTRMGDASFHMAGEYGKNAADYLTGIQEASQAGYQDAQGIAELSLALQTAGDMTSQLASQLIQATDEAYNMNGSVERLTAALDGMVSISSHNTLNMEELSQGVSSISSTAASLGVSAAQAAAALGAMMDATRDSGSDTAQAFQSILLYTRQISDSSAGINADGLKEYEEACAALNVKLKETRDGVVSLRNPMDILGELSLAYNKLSDSDSRKTGLLSALGEESQSKHLDALLRRWDTYESMLYQYTTGAGAMADKVSMTADSWEGSLNRLSNTWFSVINNIVDSDSLIFLVNNLNNVISAIDRLTGKVKSMTGDLGNVGALIGLLASMKNVGKPKMFGFISL